MAQHPASNEEEPQIQELGEKERKIEGEKSLKVPESIADNRGGMGDLTNKDEELLGAGSPVEELQRRLTLKEREEEELRQSMETMLEEKGKEMSDLILSVEKIEDSQMERQKEIAKLEAECEVADKDMKKQEKKKKRLEDYLESYTSEAKAKLKKLQTEIDSMKGMLSSPEKQNCTKPAPPSDEATNASAQLLRFISKQIEDAEKELECPVCLEIALEAPIYRCEEDHLICSKCRGKVSSCPYCRVNYPKGAWKRLRGAERGAEKLADMYRERKSLLQ